MLESSLISEVSVLGHLGGEVHYLAHDDRDHLVVLAVVQVCLHRLVLSVERQVVGLASLPLPLRLLGQFLSAVGTVSVWVSE